MAPPRPLPPRQAAVLELVEEALARQGRPPTVRDLARRLGVSPPAAWKHLRALETKGLLERKRYAPRGITLPGLRGGGASVEVPILGRVVALVRGYA